MRGLGHSCDQLLPQKAFIQSMKVCRGHDATGPSKQRRSRNVTAPFYEMQVTTLGNLALASHRVHLLLRILFSPLREYELVA